MDTTRGRVAGALVLTAYRGSGRGALYDDGGDDFAYERGALARTAFKQRTKGRTTTLTIGAARGRFPGQATARSYELRFAGLARRPARVTVAGRRVKAVAYDAATHTATVKTGRLSTRARRPRSRALISG